MVLALLVACGGSTKDSVETTVPGDALDWTIVEFDCETGATVTFPDVPVVANLFYEVDVYSDGSEYRWYRIDQYFPDDTVGVLPGEERDVRCVEGLGGRRARLSYAYLAE